jgi:hypothetical protein
MFSDLASPAEASCQTTNRAMGFAQAGNRYPLFGIMLVRYSSAAPRRSGISRAVATMSMR